MIVAVGPRRCAVLTDEPTASYLPQEVAIEMVSPAARRQGGAQATRASVEILRHGGGLMPRALPGGCFTPGKGDLVLEVGIADNDGEPPGCASQLGTALVAGLPKEYELAVVNGLTRRALSPGRLVIDRAGHDRVESSALAFELTAELLATVLAMGPAAQDLESAVRAVVQAWP